MIPLPQCLKRIIAEGVSGNVEVLRQHGKTLGLSLFIASTRVSGQNVVVHWKKLVKERKLYEQPLVTWMGIKPEQNESFLIERCLSGNSVSKGRPKHRLFVSLDATMPVSCCQASHDFPEIKSTASRLH